MDTSQIIQEINSEIARLEQAKILLIDGKRVLAKRRRKPIKVTSFSLGSGHGQAQAATVKPRKRGTISAEGRARIVAAQKARWAKTKRSD